MAICGCKETLYTTADIRYLALALVDSAKADLEAFFEDPSDELDHIKRFVLVNK
jgi:hypothetical protein